MQKNGKKSIECAFDAINGSIYSTDFDISISMK